MKKIIITEAQLKTLLEARSTYELCNNLIKQGYLVHGTNVEFELFSNEFIKGGCRAREGYGFYFTDTAYKAEEYGSIIKAVKKDMFNFVELRDSVEYGSPLYYKLFGNDINAKKRKELELQINLLIDEGRYREALNLYDEIDRLGDTSGVLYGSLRRDCLQAVEDFGAKNLGSLQYLLINPNKNLPLLAQALMELGYDGGHDNNVYTIWNINKLNQNLVKINEPNE